MILVASLSATILAQNAGTVSLDLDAVPLSAVLKAASQVSGESHEASGTFINEPVTAHVSGLSVQEFRESVAKVMDATWSPGSDGKWHLVRNPVTQNELRAKYFADRAESIRQGIQKALGDDSLQWSDNDIPGMVQKEDARRRKMIDEMSGDMPQDARMTIIDNEGAAGPAAMVLNAALSSIDVNQLAAMEPSTRIAFSPNPNRMQRPFRGNIATAVRQFVVAHNAVVKEAQRLSPLPQNVEFRGPLDLAAQPIGNVAKTIVAASLDATGSYLTIGVALYGQDLTVLGQSSTTVTLEQPVPENSGTPDARKQVDWSPLASEVLAGFQKGDAHNVQGVALSDGNFTFRMVSGPPKPPANLSKEAWNAITNPTSKDPLSLFVSEAVSELGKSTAANVVARVPDTTFARFAKGFRPGKYDLTQVSNQLTNDCTVQTVGAVTTIKPKWSYHAEGQRFDRRSMQSLLQSASSKLYIPLDDAINYLKPRSTAAKPADLDMALLDLVAPGGHDYLTQDLSDDFWAVKFLAGGGTQTARLRSGEVIRAIGQLNQQEYRALENQVYSRSSGAMMIGRGTMVMVSAGSGPDDGPRRKAPADPTEAFPNGLPRDGQVKLSLGENEAVLASVPETKQAKFFSADSLGMYNSFLGDPNMADAFAGQARFSMFQPAVERVFNFGASAGDQFLATALLNDAFPVRNSVAVKYDSLPQAFRDRVKAAEEKMKSSSLGIGNNQKPPPR